MELWEQPGARVGVLQLYATRAEVEERNIDSTAITLGKLLVPEVARRVRGRLFFGIRGYEDDVKDLWEFPEVRTWMQDLNAQFPYWFYFMDLGPHSTLAFVAFSLCQYEKVPGGKRLPPEELRRFLVSGLATMNLLCKQIGESPEIAGQRSKQVVQFFFPETPSTYCDLTSQ
jgi:hypothetical protein